MNDYPNLIKERLTSIIKEMLGTLENFVKNPDKDFTRKRKLTFEIVMQLLISMGGNSIYRELLEASGYDINTATAPAFVQQRDKILPSAFEYLLHNFTQSFSDTRKYRGFRLLAFDGSDLNFAADPNNQDTYFQNRDGEKGYNLMHLNALYDLRSRLYVDSLVQPRRCENEFKALTDMVDRSPIQDDVIIIADRGLESYNNFAHIERKGWKYIIRVKDISSGKGITSAIPLPKDGEFDIVVRRILTRRQTSEVKEHPELYRFLPSKATFDFLTLKSGELYPISFRVVRFKITDDTYETLVANLEHSSFSPDELKALYNMRWGIETSFRELKYAVGLTNFHAKKAEYIVQEIFARLIMYNFSEMITSHVVIQQRDTQYVYQVNFTFAIHICMLFLRSRNNALVPDVEALIQKNILPIRPGRKDKRKIRYKTAVSFLYRVA